MRSNSETRHSPTDLDEPDEKQRPVPSAENMQFDYHHKGGVSGWPERHRYSKIKFGPGLIKKAWQVGLIVLAEVDGFPNPVAVKEAQWTGGVFEIKTLDGPRIPTRLFTRRDVRGLKSTGEWIEPGD